ncbi:AraC family transcriptional regulator [Larkinella humicola]|uniref:Helix-turn-helix transcriptional regulator n=1 Tax=Larkinella humicola TaxID=2607654 RepID=A0A5N1JLU6_9BACT|nr:AraC family transcriptional regulator [Larkinella humicola]KAA9357164.1 helix-turn-helix transcriptional regulator [Larkinella humicola]
MRPDRLLVPQQPHRSFDLRHERLPFFTNPWHFHPEIELNFVVNSTGMRFIGHTIERFSGGEIVLLGSNLPHYWKNDVVHPEAENPASAEAIVARFAPQFAGEPFWELPETKPIQRLLNRAGIGLKLLEPLRTDVARQLVALLENEGLTQLTALLHILDQIAHSEAVLPIAPGYVPNQQVTRQSERLSRVIGHLMQQVEAPVSLVEIAELANMNPAAFCRYFKSQMGQTLTQFVTDLRIRYACDLLTRTDESITFISEQSGFENISYFVQAFRKKQGVTPARFRQRLRGV